MEELTYELIKMADDNIPAKIFHAQVASNYAGCVFHWHEQLEFYYVISGGVDMMCNGKQDWIESGDIGFVNWCEPHRGAHFKDNTEHYIIQVDLLKIIDESQLKSGKSYFSPALNYLASVPTYIRCDDILNGYFKTLITEYNEKDAGFDLVIRATIQYILTHLLRTYCMEDSQLPKNVQNFTSLDLIQKLLLYISNHYTTKLTLDGLASYIGLSISYMCRLFKEHVGLTIFEYINELRCERAAGLITNGVLLDEVYSLVGFQDYNYFSRIFRSKRGVAPSFYKNRAIHR